MAEDTLTPGSVAAPAPGSPATVIAPKRPTGPDKAGFYWGTGRRKTAIARVRIKPGSGKITINDREMAKFFTEVRDQADVASPLKLTKTDTAIDVWATVNGGGFAGQAGAVKLGIARALKGYDPTLEPTLREHSLLTRDSREVERKKYGQAGARRRFQFSKR